MIRDGRDVTRVAFSVASYRHYLKYRVDDKGAPFGINDPRLTMEDMRLIESNDPLDFLRLSAFRSVDLRSASPFAEAYGEMVEGLKNKGVLALLETIAKESTMRILEETNIASEL
jgi:mannitol 2-dehydrogenase